MCRAERLANAYDPTVVYEDYQEESKEDLDLEMPI